MASGKARRVGGRGRSLPCGCSDGPAASLRHAAQAASRGRAARGRALAPAASHLAARLGAPRRNSVPCGAGAREQTSPPAGGRPSTTLSTESASELGSALKSWSAATEFCACGWRTSARSSRKRTDEPEDARAKRSRALVFSPSRFLDNAYDPPQLLKEMTFSAAFRCVQAWFMEKPAVRAEADVASLAAL